MEQKIDSSTSAADSLVDLLDRACKQLQMPLDRPRIRRELATSLEAGSAHTAASLLQAVLDTAPSAGIQADLMSVDVVEACKLVRPGAPLALIRDDDDGTPSWFLVLDYRGDKLTIVSSEDPERSRRVRYRKFAAQLASGGQSQSWISLQGMYPCTSSKPHEAPPLTRYLDLLQPERADIFVIVVLAIVIGLLTLSTPIAVEALVNTVAFGQLMQPVVVLALILLTFLGFSAAMRALQTYMAEIIQQRIFVRVSADLAHRLPRVPRSYWDSHHGPELVNRFFDVVTVQKVTSQLLIDGFALVLQALVGMSVIAFYHPLLLGFDVFLLALIAAIVLILGRGAVTTAIAESKCKYQMAAWLEELARHPTAFRGKSQFRYALDVADRLLTDYVFKRRAHFRILMRQVVAALAVQAIASTVLLGLGGWLVIRGELTLGQLVAAELIVTVIISSLAKFGKHLESYYDVAAAIDKLGHLFDMPMAAAGGIEIPRNKAGLSIVSSALQFVDGHGRSFTTLPLRVRPAERVALTGGSSQHRKYVLETIAGLRTPASGHVELDGLDARRLRPDSVLDQVAYVSQIELFEGTILENLHMGRAEATEERIRYALSDVNLLNDILDLPDGLATRIDATASRLSIEQRIRLVIARALAGNPRLLLIDEVLDRLPDNQLAIVAANIVAPVSNRSCIISTGRREVLALCSRCIDMTSATKTEAVAGAAAEQSESEGS